MNSQFITGSYQHDGSIKVWYRDENGKKDHIQVVGFVPYFCVPENSNIAGDDRFREVVKDCPDGLLGERLWQLNVSDPGSVPELRKWFDKHWEADIRFVKRLLIDTEVKSGFELSPGQKVIHYSDFKPTDFSSDPVTCYWDTEFWTKTRFPRPELPIHKLLASSMWDSQYKKYLTFMLSPTTKRRETVGDWHKVYCETEQEIAGLTKDYFNEVKPDVLTGWNIWFDVENFSKRCRFLKMPVSFEFACIFDLCGGYKSLHKSLGNRLKEVVIDEGIDTQVVSEEFHLEYWEKPETREKFMLYSKKDVEYIVKLDTGFIDVRTGEFKKYDIVPFFWDLKNFVGQEDMENMTHGLLIDCLLLRKAHGKYVLPSTPPKEERGKERSFKAATVFEPPEGVYENLAVLDATRYYPNIVKAYYEKVIRFSPDGKENLFPEIIDDLMAKREEYESIMANSDPNSNEYKNAKRKRDLVKSPLLSGIWGYIAWSGSRVFDKKKAEFIARKAREGLELAKSSVTNLGFDIKYGDTDSLMCQVEFDEVGDLVDKLNKVFTDYCEKEGIPSLLKIKLDKFYRRAFWIEKEGTKGKGAKKKYMGWCVWEGGRKVDYIDTKGFEMIRADSSKVTRRLQGDVGDAILRKGTEGLVERIQKIIRDMKEGCFSYDEIAITKTLHKALDSVSKKSGKIINMDYYRGARYGNRFLNFDIQPEDMVKMLYLKQIKGFPSTNVICYLDSELLPTITVDIEKMIDRTVRMKVEKMLKLAGITWYKIQGVKPLESFWS